MENTEENGIPRQRIFVIVTVARQVEGDMINIRFEKGFSQLSKAEEYVRSLAKTYVETITTPDGPIQFACERGIHEIDITQ